MLYAAARRHRMNRVANYMRSHLTEPMDLERLAKVACLSKYQFIRVFSNYYQETPINCLWRLRLEYGARSLVFSNEKTITNIAMGFGYATSQNFSRAFNQRFGVPPRIFRSNNPEGFSSLEQVNLSPDKIEHTKKQAIQIDCTAKNPVRIEVRPVIRTAYIRYIGSYWDSDGEMSNTFDRLVMWARSNGLWDSAAQFIGICPDNSGVTLEGHCTYDVCLPVPDTIQEDDVVSIQTIPAGSLAIMTVDKDTTLKDAWKWLATWVKENVVVYDFRQPYEVYPIINEQNAIEEREIELCIRLEHT